VKSFETWRQELKKKHGVVEDLSSELLEGEAQVKEAMNLAKGPDKSELKLWLDKWNAASNQEERITIALDEILATLVGQHEKRAAWSTYAQELTVIVDRERARYSAWYEIFPRSEGTVGLRWLWVHISRKRFGCRF